MKGIAPILLRTVLSACLILLLGVTALYGVRNLLPEHTGEYRTYSAVEQHLLPIPEESEALTLYPWKQLTQIPEETLELAGAEPFLSELANVFGLMNASVDFSDAELLYNQAYTMFGMKNVTVWTELYSEIETDKQSLATVIAETDSYRLSFAIEDEKAGETLCFFRLERTEQALSRSALETGYASLCEQANTPFETETAFVRFLEQYGTACVKFGFTDAISAFAMQIENGIYSSFLYENHAYFCYTGDNGSLTLICDPLTQTVTGFSLETV